MVKSRGRDTGLTKIQYMAFTSIMAAFITIMTAFICHIPVGSHGGYIHFGDALIYLAAVLLPRPYAFFAAALGAGLADLFTAPMWIPATILIKIAMTLPFSNHTNKMVTKRNVLATFLAYGISGLGYFWAEYILFGTWSVFLVSMTENFIQSSGSAVLFLVVGVALDKAHVKGRYFMVI